MLREPPAASPNDEPSLWHRIRPVAPMHPILVHFSIALTTSSLAFDLLARLLDESSFAHAGWWSLAASTLLTAGTVVTGLVSRSKLEFGEGPARAYLRLHMALGPIFFGSLLILCFWRYMLWSADVIPEWLYLAALAALGLLMLVQGYLGGELVYRWGAEVQGRHSTLRQETARSPRPSRAAERR